MINDIIPPDKICDFGCGQKAKIYFKYSKKYCCETNVSKCSNIKKINGAKSRGRKLIAWNKGLTKETDERVKKISKKLLGRVNSIESNEKNRISNIGKKMPPRTNEWRKNQSNYMKNGGALKAIKGIKQVSNEELILRGLVQKLYPECVFQYPIFNYSLDIALPKYKIAIEYDGHYHFHTKEAINYFKLRQEKIEKEGWLFLRYTMFDKCFPSLIELENKIIELIRGII